MFRLELHIVTHVMNKQVLKSSRTVIDGTWCHELQKKGSNCCRLPYYRHWCVSLVHREVTERGRVIYRRLYIVSALHLIICNPLFLFQGFSIPSYRTVRTEFPSRVPIPRERERERERESE